MKIDWRPYDRASAAVLLLQEAARTVEAGGSVPVAVALASSGAQYFSDRVRAMGEESALFFIRRHLPSLTGRPSEWLVDWVKRRSNALKHANKPEEPPEVLLAPELATMLILCGIGDCFRATGRVDDALTGFQIRQRKILEERLAGSPLMERANRWLPALQEQVQEAGFGARPSPSA